MMIDVSVKAPLAELRPKAAKLRKELTRYGRQIAIPHWASLRSQCEVGRRRPTR